MADYVIRKVNEAGADHIFLITGRGILYLTDAVAKNENMVHVSAYHEQGASYAALAYAAAKDCISVCLVSTGCAAANAAAACLCAYQDNLPVVFISGNNPLDENTRHTKVPIRTYGSQEADIISMAGSMTKYAVMLEDKDRIVYEVEKAVYLAQEGRKGPVWIDVPLDVQNMRIDERGQEHFTEPGVSGMPSKLSKAVERIAEELSAANRPILLIGAGARGASGEIRSLVDSFCIPLAFSPSAADIYGASNALSVGAVGSLGGSRAGNFAVQNADYILAVGTKLCSQETGRKNAFAREAKITVVDIDQNEHTKDGVSIDTVVCSDAKIFLSNLLKQKIRTADTAWINKCMHWKDIFSIDHEAFIDGLKQEDKLDIYIVANIISEHLPENATVITDAGFEELIIPSTICFGDQHRCLFPASQGAMGYAVPAILGAYYAGRKNLICIGGDGSFMMNMQELGIIAYHNIPVKIFVLNNNMYSVIRKRQKDLFRSRTIGNDPSDGVPAPDFKKIAESIGMKYQKTASVSRFQEDIRSYLEQEEGISLIEVVCTPDQKYLHESYALNERRRLVHRPIEDMAPFLDRERIKAEMIIDMLVD